MIFLKPKKRFEAKYSNNMIGDFEAFCLPVFERWKETTTHYFLLTRFETFEEHLQNLIIFCLGNLIILFNNFAKNIFYVVSPK